LREPGFFSLANPAFQQEIVVQISFVPLGGIAKRTESLAVAEVPNGLRRESHRGTLIDKKELPHGPPDVLADLTEAHLRGLCDACRIIDGDGDSVQQVQSPRPGLFASPVIRNIFKRGTYTIIRKGKAVEPENAATNPRIAVTHLPGGFWFSGHDDSTAANGKIGLQQRRKRFSDFLANDVAQRSSQLPFGGSIHSQQPQAANIASIFELPDDKSDRNIVKGIQPGSGINEILATRILCHLRATS
jgi:hypothetical protein